MIFIGKEVEAFKKDHLEALEGKCKSLIEKKAKGPLKPFLNKNLSEILIGKPEQLQQLNDKLKSLFPKRYMPITELNEILNYKAFSNPDKKEYNAYQLAKNLNINICPYCNRSYIKTVRDLKENLKKKRVTRPQFDHFLDKAKNPLLALSFYNLIPSCPICNSTLKGSESFCFEKNFHPYVDDFEELYRYTYLPDNYAAFIGKSEELKIDIVISSNATANKQQKMRNHIKTFKLKEINSAHASEVKDILQARQLYGLDYLERLNKTFNLWHRATPKDVYRLSFGTMFPKEDDHKRPFNKMKRDLLRELGMLNHMTESP